MIAVPGLTPTFPTMADVPVLVTVDAPRMAKLSPRPVWWPAGLDLHIVQAVSRPTDIGPGFVVTRPLMKSIWFYAVSASQVKSLRGLI